MGFSAVCLIVDRAKLNLKTLELRRLHYDLVMCYKIVFNIIRYDTIRDAILTCARKPT